jgi:uncharacterized protein YdaU (DUF1376 family)
MSKLPSMPMWWSDFFTKTDHLNNEEQWAYAKLMAKTWLRNCEPLPDVDSDIARLLNMGIKRWLKIRRRIEPFFDLSNATWRQPHLENVFLECAARAASSRSNGALGGRPKSNKINKIVKPTGSAGGTQQEPTPNLSKTKAKEERKKDSEAKASAAAVAPAMLPDPVKILWNRGLALLLGAELPDARARRLIGGWRKEFSDAAVLAAIVACEHEAASEPVAFIAGCLHHSRKGMNGHGRLTPANERFIAGREATFRAVLDAEERERSAHAGYQAGDSS